MFFVLNETCPPSYLYPQKASSTGCGGGLSVIYRDELDLCPLPLPELSSFECLAFKCKPLFLTTVLLIHCPPKPNPAFIPEMYNLLSSFFTTSANSIILGDMNIHLNIPSCCLAVKFLQFMDCFNLTQHVDAPTHTRGHTLDLVIKNSAPISNLVVYDLGVSDHKVISMELPYISPHIKKKHQLCSRNLKNINPVNFTVDLQCLLSAELSSASDSVDFYIKPCFTSWISMHPDQNSQLLPLNTLVH